MTDRIPVLSPPFRPGTSISPARITFIFNAGGIGDYINWVPAVRCAIETNPHVSGYIVSQSYFAPLAEMFLRDLAPRFEVREVSTSDYSLVDFIKETDAIIVPNKQQYASASSHNLFELGYIYYCQRDRAPEGATLPRIRGDEADVSRFALPEDFVVLTPNATADNRRLSAKVLNEIITYVLGLGLTPVFLGKSSLAKDYVSRPDEGLDLSGVLDLREKTTLPETAVILSRSRLTFGLDNGLLHLAACGPAPVLWVFTSVDPRHRIAPRPYPDSVTRIITPSERLSCRFCQSQIRYVLNHDFKDCLYKDNLCLTALEAKHIIPMIAEILKEKK